MKNILKVYRRDLINIVKNPIAFIIIVGVAVLPSLYAWVNIKACWDPYEKTSTIPVAVVNKDKGTTFKEKDINIGSNVIENLKKNHSIGWKFVNEKEAELGVVDGTYYAIIEIPEDFSSDFTTILTDNIKKPQIIYKVDNKENAIATKITDTAKGTLVQQITSSFIATVNETAFAKLNDVGKSAAKNKENIIKLKDDIVLANRNMNLITGILQNINSNSKNLDTLLVELKAGMPAVNSGIATLGQHNEDTQKLILSTQTTMNTSMDNIQVSLTSAQASVNKTYNLLQSLNSTTTASTNSQVNSTIAKANMELDSISNGLTPIINYLDTINTTNPNAEVSKMIASLKSIQASLTDEKSKLNDLQQKFIKTNELNKNLLDSANDQLQNINTQLISSLSQYNTKTRASLNSIADSLVAATKDASELIKNAQGLSDQIDKLMATSIDGTNLTTKISGDLNNRLLQYKDIVKKLGDQLEQVNNNNMIEIITILQSNPQFMGSFVATPFDIKEESVYGLPNYGSAMSPVYTVLALWVGCLILNSLLKTEVTNFEGLEDLTIRERHFGKMLLFVTLAIIQALIASIGDIVLLKVYVVSPALMIAFAVVSSITFSIICFTLVSTLGNFGKALSIVYMIIQLAGSGGTYPIQVDPLIFRILQPLFPFTYSINGIREAAAGPLISKVVWDFVALALFAIAFILFGFFFKERLYERIVHKFETNFEESGIGE